MSRTTYKGVLTRVVSTNNNLRTPSVEGVFSALPIKGDSFTLIGESLTPENDFRDVTTSEVQEVTELEPGRVTFKTYNSTYELTYIEMPLSYKAEVSA